MIAQNYSNNKDHPIQGTLRVDTVLYTGKVGSSVKELKFDTTIKARVREEIKLDVSFNEYYDRLVDQVSPFQLFWIFSNNPSKIFIWSYFFK